MTPARTIQTRPMTPFVIRFWARCSASAFAPASVFSMPPQTMTAPQIVTPRPIAIATSVEIILVTGASAFWAPDGTESAAATGPTQMSSRSVAATPAISGRYVTVKARVRGRMAASSADGRSGRRSGRLPEPADAVGDLALLRCREVKAGRAEPGDNPGQATEPVIFGRRDEDADVLPARVDRGRPALADLIEDRGEPALDLGDPDRVRDIEDLPALPPEPPDRGSARPIAPNEDRPERARVVGELRVHLEAVRGRQRPLDRDPALDLVAGEQHGRWIPVLEDHDRRSGLHVRDPE